MTTTSPLEKALSLVPSLSETDLNDLIDLLGVALNLNRDRIIRERMKFKRPALEAIRPTPELTAVLRAAHPTKLQPQQLQTVRLIALVHRTMKHLPNRVTIPDDYTPHDIRGSIITKLVRKKVYVKPGIKDWKYFGPYTWVRQWVDPETKEQDPSYSHSLAKREKGRNHRLRNIYIGCQHLARLMRQLPARSQARSDLARQIYQAYLNNAHDKLEAVIAKQSPDNQRLIAEEE